MKSWPQDESLVKMSENFLCFIIESKLQALKISTLLANFTLMCRNYSLLLTSTQEKYGAVKVRHMEITKLFLKIDFF